MEMDLKPKLAQKIFDGEGGSYYSWLVSESPILGEAKVGAGKLVLQPRGFALPHYADSSKVGYVLQGSDGVVGIVLSKTSTEVVLKLKKGDVLPVPLGSVSWWYNNGDSELQIVFLGETSKSYVAGEFTYFLLTGAQGIIGGFSNEFTSRAYHLNEKEAKTLTKSQTGVLIIKLEAGQAMPQPYRDAVDKLVYNLDAESPDVNVKNGGLATALTAAEFAFLEQAGLSVRRVKLDANAMLSPTYTGDATVQLFYVANGSGHVQIVGINGKLVLDTEIKAGQLFVVPRFFVVAQTAGADGMETFTVITKPRPIVEALASKESVWNVLSPKVLQASLNVTPEFEEVFKSKIRNSAVIVPPKN